MAEQRRRTGSRASGRDGARPPLRASPGLTGAEAETLADRAYRLIEDEIVRLALAPGARLTEQDLAARIGLGRTPVREAVQRLVADGLLVVFPRKGMAVAAINPLDVLLALDARAALERVVAAAAARRATPAAARGAGGGGGRDAGRGRARRPRPTTCTATSASTSSWARRPATPSPCGRWRRCNPWRGGRWFYFRRERDLAASSPPARRRRRRDRGGRRRRRRARLRRAHRPCSGRLEAGAGRSLTPVGRLRAILGQWAAFSRPCNWRVHCLASRPEPYLGTLRSARRMTRPCVPRRLADGRPRRNAREAAGCRALAGLSRRHEPHRRGGHT